MTVDTSEVVNMLRKGDKVGVLVYLRNGGDANARNQLGWTLLHLACVEGQAQIVEVLLEAGASVNSCTTDMCTPLHRASSHGYSSCVELLLKKNAYVNAQDKSGNTPLHEAARGFHTTVAKMLINKKADTTKTNRKNQVFLQLVGQQLMPAVECGDTEVLVQWLDWGLNPDTKGNLHWSILHHASARGQLNIVSLLLERGANVNIEDSNRTSPLHTASFHGHLRVADLLVNSGANVNAQDQRGNTPLHSAIEGSHPGIINLLLERGCDTSLPNKEGQIFTHLVNEFLVTAVHAANVGQVVSLLKGQADPNTRDSYGFPVLCHSAFKGDVLIADALLESGANPNLGDAGGKTPLHHAAYWGNLFVLKSLLDKGATVNIQDKHGCTPLHDAAREGSEDVITVLTGRGAKVDVGDDEGNTPLHIAARWGQLSTVEQLLEKGATENIKNKDGLLYSDLALIRAVRTEEHSQVMSGLAWGGDPNSRDSRGWTLLHHAVYKGTQKICELLLECGANVNAADDHGRTPLLLAAYRGEHQIMQILMEEGADINAQDWMGHTPLHWAAKEGSADTVDLLLDHQAHTHIKNKEGLLYSDLLLKHLYLAVRHNDADKVVRLVRAGADQFAEVEGTGLNPREEAKRQGLYDILRAMAALAKKEEPLPEDDKIIALEDVYRLFEDGYSTEDDVLGSSAEEGRSEDDDDDQDAYWKMSNAYEVLSAEEAFKDEDDWLDAWQEKPKVISAKELFEEDQAAFWEIWEDKPKVIPAKELFKEESNWWEKDDNDEDDDKEGGDEDKSHIPSAKEFFRDDECWWRDALEDLQKPQVVAAKDFFKDEKPWWEVEEEEERNKAISAKEFFKDEDKPWWEEEDKEKAKVISVKDLFKDEKPWWEEEEENKVISAKEFFKDEDKPWWETEEVLLHQEKSSSLLSGLKKNLDSARSSESENYESEEEEQDEDSATESSGDEIEEWSHTEDYEDANDSLLSDSSTMYSASEGERLQASVIFRDTPWWEESEKLDQPNQNNQEDKEIKMSEQLQEKHYLDDMSEASEATETLDMDTSEISEAATELSQTTSGNPWTDNTFQPRVERSRRSNIGRMKTDISTGEDSEGKDDIEEEEEEREYLEKDEEEAETEDEVEMKDDTYEDGDNGIGEEEYNSESEEVKSEDEIEDILEEEEVELDSEDNVNERANVPSRRLSPLLCSSEGSDNTTPGDRDNLNITPIVSIDESEVDAKKIKIHERRERNRDPLPVQKTPLDILVEESVSKRESLVMGETNIDVDTTKIDTFLDPNQLYVDVHYLEGNLQKSDSQTSGYESSLSLSESKTNIYTTRECEFSVVTACNETTDAEIREEIKNSDGLDETGTRMKKVSPERESKHASVNEVEERQTDGQETQVDTQDDKTQIMIKPRSENKNAEELENIQSKSEDGKIIVMHMKFETNDDTINISEAEQENTQRENRKVFEEEEESEVEENSNSQETSIRCGKYQPAADDVSSKTYAEALKEKLGDKTTVNKMDACLAKVDASLAWVDARLTKDSNGTSSEKERQIGEDARTPMTHSASVTPKYCGVKKVTKLPGRDEGPTVPSKTRSDDKDTVLLMKVHVHVPEESSKVRTAEEITVISQDGRTSSDSVSSTFLGVVNNGDYDLKKSPKFVSRLPECVVLDKEDVNTSTTKSTDQILASKRSTASEHYPTDESDPASGEEIPEASQNKPKQHDQENESGFFRECLEKEKGKTHSNNQGSETTKSVEGDENMTVHSSLNKKTTSTSNNDDDISNADRDTRQQDSYHLTREKEKQNKMPDATKTKVNVEKERGEKLSRESSLERSVPDDGSSIPRPLPQKTLWRCSTYESMSISDYDNLAFLIHKSSSSPACWTPTNTKQRSLSIESLDKARDESPEDTKSKSTSEQSQGPSQDTKSKSTSEQSQGSSQDSKSKSTSEQTQGPSQDTKSKSTSEQSQGPSQDSKSKSISEQSQGPSQDTKSKSTSEQSQRFRSDSVKTSRVDKVNSSSSKCYVKQDTNTDCRDHVERVTSSSSSSHGQKGVTKLHVDRCESQSESRGDINMFTKEPPQKQVACEASPPVSSQVTHPAATVAAQACTNSSDISSAHHSFLLPPRKRERKVQGQIDKDAEHSAESKYTNAVNKPSTNTALLYDPDKKEVGKIEAARPDVPQAKQVSAKTSKELKCDKDKTKEFCAAAGKSDPVRKSSSCHIS
ncbi:uncharacterized protein LOC121857104 isoform X2 [Homarus americanus]|nr:uncharacterized protein LOC121857104 isoform X2 [Homarus americanus]